MSDYRALPARTHADLMRQHALCSAAVDSLRAKIAERDTLGAEVVRYEVRRTLDKHEAKLRSAAEHARSFVAGGDGYTQRHRPAVEALLDELDDEAYEIGEDLCPPRDIQLPVAPVDDLTPEQRKESYEFLLKLERRIIAATGEASDNITRLNKLRRRAQRRIAGAHGDWESIAEGLLKEIRDKLHQLDRPVRPVWRWRNMTAKDKASIKSYLIIYAVVAALAVGFYLWTRL